MAEEGIGLRIGERLRIEKRTIAGEIFEILEVVDFGDGSPPKVYVTFRKEGIAPSEEYARDAERKR